MLMGASEGEFVKLRKVEPTSNWREAEIRGFGTVGFKRDAVAGDGVLDDAEWFGIGESESDAACCDSHLLRL